MGEVIGVGSGCRGRFVGQIDVRGGGGGGREGGRPREGGTGRPCEGDQLVMDVLHEGDDGVHIVGPEDEDAWVSLEWTESGEQAR